MWWTDRVDRSEKTNLVKFGRKNIDLFRSLAAAMHDIEYYGYLPFH